MPKYTKRIQTYVSPEFLLQIFDYMKLSGAESQYEAMRRLLEVGVKVERERLAERNKESPEADRGLPWKRIFKTSEAGAVPPFAKKRRR